MTRSDRYASRPSFLSGTCRHLRKAGLVTLAAIALVVLAAGCGNGEPSAQEIEAKLNEGLQAHVEGRLTDAAQKYREVLELDEDNKFAIYNLGLIDQNTGRPTDAELKYRRVLQLDPNYGPALFNLAILRTLKGDTNEAISLYRRAIEAQPDDASAHLNLGLLLRANGQVEEGEAMIQRARELNPQINAPAADGTSPTTTAGAAN